MACGAVRKHHLRWFLLASTLALAACKDDKPQTTAPSASAKAAASGTPASEASAKDSAKNAAPASDTKAGDVKAAPAGDRTDTPASHVHLPADCDVLVHVNLDQILGHPSIKKEIVPKLDAALKRPPQDPGGKGAQEFLKKTGIDPLKDLKTLSFCARKPASKKPSFVATLGGSLTPGTVAQAAVASMPQQFKLLKVAGLDAARAGKLQYVGQAKDGVILVANAEAMFEAGTKSDKGAEALKLPVDKTLALLINEATLKAAAKNSQAGPLDAHLAKAQRLQVLVDAATGAIEGRIQMPDATSAAELGGAIKAGINQSKGQAIPGVPPMLAGNLQKTEISYSGNDVILKLTIDGATLDTLAKVMSGVLAGGSGMRMQRTAPGQPGMGHPGMGHPGVKSKWKK